MREKESEMDLPPVVSPEEWKAHHQRLLAKEKEATRARDSLAAERRRQPMVRFDKEYLFDAPDGKASLGDLFEGRRQLIVYHFMFQPGAPNWPVAGCDGCSMFTDQVGHLAHFHARDTTFALVSQAEIGKLEAFRKRMGWEIPWYSLAGNDFNADCGVRGGFGLSVFLRHEDQVFRTYFTSGRGVEALGSVWSFLDLTPLGRQEDWEDSPADYPQTPRYEWWRLHDEYEEA
jgi:predicted dithiol-disulfide oxidoreductase (DUF899 family)